MLDLLMWFSIVGFLVCVFILGAAWGTYDTARRIKPRIDAFVDGIEEERRAYDEFRDAAFKAMQDAENANAFLRDYVENSHAFETPRNLN